MILVHICICWIDKWIQKNVPTKQLGQAIDRSNVSKYMSKKFYTCAILIHQPSWWLVNLSTPGVVGRGCPDLLRPVSSLGRPYHPVQLQQVPQQLPQVSWRTSILPQVSWRTFILPLVCWRTFILPLEVSWRTFILPLRKLKNFHTASSKMKNCHTASSKLENFHTVSSKLKNFHTVSSKLENFHTASSKLKNFHTASSKLKNCHTVSSKLENFHTVSSKLKNFPIASSKLKNFHTASSKMKNCHTASTNDIGPVLVLLVWWMQFQKKKIDNCTLPYELLIHVHFKPWSSCSE